jgi:MscS family membrane protein
MEKPTLHLFCDDRSKKVTWSGPTQGWNGTCIAALTSLLILCSMMRPGTLSAAEDRSAVKPADTSSPRATLKCFIDSCNELHQGIQAAHYFDRASPEHRPLIARVLDCLDVSELPEYERLEAAGEVAVCLKEILDRVELPPYEEIPNLEAIEAAGGLEKLSQWRIPGTRITIARVEEGPQRHEYLFSPGTVGRALEYHEDLKSLPYRTAGPEVSEGFYRWYVSAPGNPTVAAVVDRLPDWARGGVYGQSVWKWAGLLFSLLVAILLMWVTYKLYGRLARRFHGKAPLRYCLTILLPIVAMLIPLGFRHFVFDYLTLRGTTLYVVSFAANITALLASLIVVFGASNRIAEIIIASPQINPQGLNAQLIRITSKLLSLLAAVIISLQGGHYLGIPVTTLLASAGIGGLALALAAQDTLKNLLGTIMLLSDKPFRVGERIIFGKYDGIIEDIGLRSTKIRLLTGHQATIPNDELARTDIENVGRRPYIRRIADIHIPLDTPRDKVERAVVVIRAALENHEGMAPEFPPRVYFFDFSTSSFIIRVIYWYNPPKYWDYLAFSEKFNFEVFRAFEERDIQFSLPARITHTSRESEEKPLEVTLLEKRHAS